MVGRQVIYTTQRRRFVYDTWDNGIRLDRVVVECTLSITHCLRLNLQLHTIDLVRTCRISSFCTIAWQLARCQLTRRIARSLGDSWASCISSITVWFLPQTVYLGVLLFKIILRWLWYLLWAYFFVSWEFGNLLLVHASWTLSENKMVIFLQRWYC